MSQVRNREVGYEGRKNWCLLRRLAVYHFTLPSQLSLAAEMMELSEALPSWVRGAGSSLPKAVELRSSGLST